MRFEVPTTHGREEVDVVVLGGNTMWRGRWRQFVFPERWDIPRSPQGVTIQKTKIDRKILVCVQLVSRGLHGPKV